MSGLKAFEAVTFELQAYVIKLETALLAEDSYEILNTEKYNNRTAFSCVCVKIFS